MMMIDLKFLQNMTMVVLGGSQCSLILLFFSCCIQLLRAFSFLVFQPSYQISNFIDEDLCSLYKFSLSLTASLFFTL